MTATAEKVMQERADTAPARLLVRLLGHGPPRPTRGEIRLALKILIAGTQAWSLVAVLLLVTLVAGLVVRAGGGPLNNQIAITAMFMLSRSRR